MVRPLSGFTRPESFAQSPHALLSKPQPLRIMKTKNAIKFPRTLREIIGHPDFIPFGSSSDEWLSDPDRMERCHEAAEDGCDGSTHGEIIGDWRKFLARLEREAHRKAWAHDRVSAEIERRAESIREEIDKCEVWHAEHGSLEEMVG